MLTIAGMHLLALGCVAVLIVPALRGDEALPPRRGDADSDDGGSGNDRRGPLGPSPLPGGGLPLPSAVPARLRLREHGRLHERLPQRTRRPAREPERTPVREPARF